MGPMMYYSEERKKRIFNFLWPPYAMFIGIKCCRCLPPSYLCAARRRDLIVRRSLVQRLSKLDRRRPPSACNMGLEGSPSVLEAGKAKDVQFATGKLAEAEVDTTYETRIRQSNALVR